MNGLREKQQIKINKPIKSTTYGAFCSLTSVDWLARSRDLPQRSYKRTKIYIQR